MTFTTLCWMLAAAVALTACGAGSSGGGGPALGSNAGTHCSGHCADPSLYASPNAVRLTKTDVAQVLAQAVAQAGAMNQPATIAVVDRVGNVLAVFRMNGVTAGHSFVTISSGTNVIKGKAGLDGLQLPVSATAPGDGLAAISKAITAAYLSSEGNGLSTRTAGNIIQRHFEPGEADQPSGPLFGVQFSQLPCSDFAERLADSATLGPKRSPLGLSADPGGFPLYKNGTPVGGVGVVSDFVYGIDRDIRNTDHDPDEIIALAATYGYAVPPTRSAERITMRGKTLRFSDVGFGAVSAAAESASPLTMPSAAGTLLAVRSYYNPAGGILAGTVFGQPASGIRAATTFPGRDAFVFVSASDANRYPATAGAAPASGPPLTANEVHTILDQALGVANAARSQLRLPVGSNARVTISVVDTSGHVLGMVRSRDAPVFGADVSLQKARTAALFSSQDAATFIRSLPDAQYLNPDLSPSVAIDFDDYVNAMIAFLGDPTALANGIAFSDRAGGNLSRPNYPDGIDGNPPGPLSKPSGQWSVFSTGIQLDFSYNAIVSHLLYVFGASANDVGKNCVGVPYGATASSVAPRIANGTEIFPGSVPIYRGNVLVGGIGVSGDGIVQDDMVSFLGLYRAGQILGTINEAPKSMRADTLTPQGVRLRYVQCPRKPFLGSDTQDACTGK